MKPWVVILAASVFSIGAGLQFVPVSRTNPPEREAPIAPADVQAILQRACYDCHSNETRWPWYSRVAPASFLISRDVSEGRRELNLSKWSQYDSRRKARKLREIAEQVEKEQMPQWYYVLLHPQARLSAADRQRLVEWSRRP